MESGGGEGEGARKAVKVLISSNESHHPSSQGRFNLQTVFKIHPFKTLEFLKTLKFTREKYLFEKFLLNSNQLWEGASENISETAL